MKALVQNGYGSIEVLEHAEIEKPSPAAGEVLVKVAAAAVNEWDTGMLNVPKWVRPFTGLRSPQGKFRIMGCDMAGRVESVGDKVTRHKPGDEVYGDLSGYRFGGFAEYVCVNEKSLVKKPASMTFEQAAALPHAAELALQAIKKVPELGAGHQVLVNGAGGGVGTLAIQILKNYNVEVTGVDRAGKLEQLRSLGYDHVIEYPDVDFTRTGQSYDFILDVKTNKSVFDYLRVLKPGGIYATVGGDRIFRFMFTVLFMKPFTGNRPKVVALKPNQNLDHINELFESGEIRPVVDSVFGFSEIHEAFARFLGAEHFGKIVIRIE